MKLYEMFKHIEDEHLPECAGVDDYDNLPSLSDRRQEVNDQSRRDNSTLGKSGGEPYDPRIEDR